MLIDPAARDEMLDLALTEAKALPESTQSWVLIELVLELDRAGRAAEALALLRRCEPSLVDVLRTRDRRPVFVAWRLLPFVNAAEHANDEALAKRLRQEAVRLLTLDREEIAQSLWLADDALEIARATGDAASLEWLATLTGEARLGIDFEELVRLRASNDPTWEALFDSLEDRVETLGEKYQDHAVSVLVRCGLPRAAFRHWMRTSHHLKVELLIALWRAELLQQYREHVEIVRREWIDSLGDWCGVRIAVELAFAQLDAGDIEGARTSADYARNMAERNFQQEATRDPEVGIWSLAHLMPLEMRVGTPERAAKVLARCRATLANAPAKHKHRVTTMGSLLEGCLAGGFCDVALELAATEKGEERFQSYLQVASRSPSLSTVRTILERVAKPLQRLDVMVSACRVPLW